MLTHATSLRFFLASPSMESVGSAPALSRYMTGLVWSISLKTDSTCGRKTKTKLNKSRKRRYRKHVTVQHKTHNVYMVYRCYCCACHRRICICAACASTLITHVHPRKKKNTVIRKTVRSALGDRCVREPVRGVSANKRSLPFGGRVNTLGEGTDFSFNHF